MPALWTNRTVLEKVLILTLAFVVLAACAQQVSAALQPTAIGCQVQSTTSNYPSEHCPGTFYVVKLWWGNPDGSPGTNIYDNCVVWVDVNKGSLWCPEPKP